MSSEIIQTLEALLSLGIAFLCVRLSKYRYQENEKYAVKYENNAKMLIIRWIITEIFKWGSILMLIGIIIKELSIFLARAKKPVHNRFNIFFINLMLLSFWV